MCRIIHIIIYAKLKGKGSICFLVKFYRSSARWFQEFRAIFGRAMVAINNVVHNAFRLDETLFRFDC